MRSAGRVQAPPPIALWHLASLDAPTVAVVWTLGFGWMAGLHLPLWIPLLLALTVWPVYVGDRLLDARAGLSGKHPDDLQERHYFHWRHRRALLPLAVCAACSAALLILFFMPVAVRERDSVLAAASFAYFVCVHAGRTRYPFLAPLLTKEFLVGVLFTTGCALPTLRRLPAPFYISSWPVFGAVAFFAVLAWLNCSAINSWESHASWILKPNRRSPFSAACWLAGSGAALAAGCFALNARAGMLLLAGTASALLLAGLDCHRNRLSPVALRAYADLALLTPAVLLSIAWIVR